MKNGMLIVISAPAGGGKDVIIDNLLENKECNLFYMVTSTTRKMREGEQNGVHYHFKSKEEFERLLEQGEFLEHTEYCGNYYGTLKKNVDAALSEGKNVVLKIETEGARNVRKIFPDCISIFILPPSLEELRRRLKFRSTEDDETIERRIKKASIEVKEAVDYNYCVINDELQTAIDEIAKIIRNEKAKRLL